MLREYLSGVGRPLRSRPIQICRSTGETLVETETVGVATAEGGHWRESGSVVLSLR